MPKHNVPQQTSQAAGTTGQTTTTTTMERPGSDLGALQRPASPAPDGPTRLDVMTKVVVRELQDQGIDPYQILADGVTTVYDFVWASNLRDLITDAKEKIGEVVANAFEDEKWQLLGDVADQVRAPGTRQGTMLGRATSPFSPTGFAAQSATATDADEGYEVYDSSIFTSPDD